MAKFYTSLDEGMKAFIAKQKMFFVATAAEGAKINVSPKGLDTFVCLDDKTVMYLDLTGTGNETAAHLCHDGRMTMMFCSFDKKPLILRLYGKGRIVRHQDTEWSDLYRRFEPLSPGRQIIVLTIESIQKSCGMGVPIYKFKKNRNSLVKWEHKQGEEGLQKFQVEKNQRSIDGLPTHLFDSQHDHRFDTMKH